MGDILTIALYIGGFYFGIQILIGVLSLAGGIIELLMTILGGIVYGLAKSIQWAIKAISGKDIMGSFNRRVKNRSGKLGGLTIDRPDSFRRSTSKTYRSTDPDRNYKKVWAKESRSGRGTHSLWIHKWAMAAWNWFIDLWREKGK